MALTVDLNVDDSKARASFKDLAGLARDLGENLLIGVGIAGDAAFKTLQTGIRATAVTTQKVFSASFRTAVNVFKAGIAGAVLGIGALFASDSFRGPISEAFQPAKDALDGLLGDLGGILAESLTPLLPQIQEIFGLVSDLITPIFESLADFISEIDLGPILDTFETLFGFISQFIEEIDFGAIFDSIDLGGILAALSPIFETIGQLALSLAPIISDIAQLLAGAFSDTLIAILPTLNSLLGVLAEVFITVYNAVQPLIEAFLEVFSQILAAALPIIEKLAEFLASLLLPVLETVFELWTQLFEAIDFESILASLTPLFDALLEVAEQLLPIYLDLFSQLAELLGDTLAESIGIISEIFVSFAEAITDFLSENPELLNELFEALSEVLIEVTRALLPLLPLFLELALQLIQDLLPVIVDILPPLIQLTVIFVKVFAEIVKLLPILVSLASTISRVISPIVRLIAAIVGFVAVTVIINSVISVLEFLGSTISSVVDEAGSVIDSFSEVWETLEENVSSAIGSIVGFIDDLIATIQNLSATINIIPDIGGALGGISNSVTGFAGNLSPLNRAYGGVTNKKSLSWLSEKHHPEAVLSSIATPQQNFNYITQAGLYEDLAPLFQNRETGATVINVQVAANETKSPGAARLDAYRLANAMDRQVQKTGKRKGLVK